MATKAVEMGDTVGVLAILPTTAMQPTAGEYFTKRSITHKKSRVSPRRFPCFCWYSLFRGNRDSGLDSKDTQGA